MIEEEKSGTVDYWKKELSSEEKAHKSWRKRAKEVMKRYRDEEKRTGSRFNILWSNTQVLHAAVLSSRPQPDVTRRFKDANPVAKDIADTIERALSYSVDSYDFDGDADATVDDFLLPALGQMRVRYVPYFEKGEPPTIPLSVRETLEDDETTISTSYFNGEEEVKEPSFDEAGNPYTYGEPPDELVYEEVVSESVPWNRFRWQAANSWSNVQWACIDHYLTKKELEDQFGKTHAAGCPLGFTDEGEKVDDTEDGKSRALIHEIFDKDNRKTITICAGYNEVLKEEDDPWGLEGFYPFPKPMTCNITSDRFVPSPDYLMYQDQALELDELTQRIASLTKELKWRGGYDGSFKDLANIAGLDDGEFEPVEDWSTRTENKRSLADSMFVLPIADLQNVIMRLHESRETVKQTIYEITGLSDIVRGTTKASETLGAQQLKQQNASLRLTKKQGEVARFFRDIFRLKAELIAEHFSAETLKMMTGVEVTDEMMDIMRSDLLRGYQIDVESESTVAADRAEEQKNVNDLLGAVTQYMTAAMPLIQMGVPAETIKEMLLFAVRRYKGGRQIEQAIEKIDIGGEGDNQGPVALPPQMGGMPPGM
jgi:hypothetical protein